MALDFKDIATKIAEAMVGVLKDEAPGLVAYARQEARKFAISIETIEALREAGVITADEAEAQVEIQKHATAAVLTSVDGVKRIIAIKAINAGLKAVGGIVNKALGIDLLPA